MKKQKTVLDLKKMKISKIQPENLSKINGGNQEFTSVLTGPLEDFLTYFFCE
ncbi:hypothetical protein [uncultured Dokdonia sp.]|uniref:hypothetical protein n=1 Tax=uncultured Dokdonia sp. TaxID=575653 RepID=UPI0026038FC2|nr:hypothetical protein [uncultured Dokdonia sp.]